MNDLNEEKRRTGRKPIEEMERKDQVTLYITKRVLALYGGRQGFQDTLYKKLQDNEKYLLEN